MCGLLIPVLYLYVEWCLWSGPMNTACSVDAQANVTDIFSFRKGSASRGDAWDSITEKLNQIHSPQFPAYQKQERSQRALEGRLFQHGTVLYNGLNQYDQD